MRPLMLQTIYNMMNIKDSFLVRFFIKDLVKLTGAATHSATQNSCMKLTIT